MLLLLGVSFSKSKGQNRINKVLGHTLLIDNKKKSKKKGQISNTLNLSRLVEPEGFEPSANKLYLFYQDSSISNKLG